MMAFSFAGHMAHPFALYIRWMDDKMKQVMILKTRR